MRYLILAVLLVFAGATYAQTAARKDVRSPLMVQALQSLRPGAQWSFGPSGYDLNNLQWLDQAQSRPTDQEINDEIARIAALPSGRLTVAEFISRWTNAEYAALMQARAAAIQNASGGMTLVRQWDMAMARGDVDLSTPAVQSFKATLVSAGILTQARADAIFE